MTPSQQPEQEKHPMRCETCKIPCTITDGRPIVYIQDLDVIIESLRQSSNNNNKDDNPCDKCDHWDCCEGCINHDRRGEREDA